MHQITRTAARTTTLALLTAALLPGAAAASSKLKCDDRPGTTIYVDRTVRVYYTLAGKPSALNHVLRVFECKRRAHSAVLLLRSNSNLDELLQPMSAGHAGNFLITEIFIEGGTADETLFQEYTLAGKKISRLDVDDDSTLSANGSQSYDYWLTTGGGFALLSVSNERGAQPSLVGYDVSGRHALATAPKNVAAGGNTIYWSDGTTAQTATLTGHPKGTLKP